MEYGEKPTQEEIDKVLTKNKKRQDILNEIKQELTKMEVGSWLVYRGKEETIGAPPIAIIAVDVKGKFEFYSEGNNCYVRRVK